MAFYQVLYWKDIPAQVKVLVEGRRPQSRQLPERYQQEIDARAMHEGLAGTDEYLDQWRWSEKREGDLSPDELVEAVVQEFERERAGLV